MAWLIVYRDRPEPEYVAPNGGLTADIRKALQLPTEGAAWRYIGDNVDPNRACDFEEVEA